MLSIVYSSKARHAFGEDELAMLLEQSRANNERLDLSGMLLNRGGRFLQVLEGPDDALRDRMAIIAADPRHTQVNILLEEQIENRFFAHWTMRYERITQEMAVEIPGYRSSFDDLAEQVTTSPTIPALRELIRWFQQGSASQDRAGG